MEDVSGPVRPTRRSACRPSTTAAHGGASPWTDPARPGAVGPGDRHHTFPGRDEQAKRWTRRAGDGRRLPRRTREERLPDDGEQQRPGREEEGGPAEEGNALAVSGAEDDLAVHWHLPSRGRDLRLSAHTASSTSDSVAGFLRHVAADCRDPSDLGQAGAGSASSGISEPATPRWRRRPMRPRRITKSWLMTKISRTNGSGVSRFIHHRLVRIRQS